MGISIRRTTDFVIGSCLLVMVNYQLNIARGAAAAQNWELRTPEVVHCHWLTDNSIEQLAHKNEWQLNSYYSLSTVNSIEQLSNGNSKSFRIRLF